MERYFNTMMERAEDAMVIAENARKKGLDPSFEVEIPFATDLPERVEKLMKVPGVADLIRACKEKDRDILAIRVAEQLARRLEGTASYRLTTATKVGLAIQTEGILVAPLDGLTEVRVGENADGTTYADMHFSGPIRSAGGTGQALSVLVCDVVRRALGVGAYKATEQEVERMQEEMLLYKKSQYRSSPTEVDLIMRNCPVCINGDGTQPREVAGHRDLPRVEGNRVRGGACLVMAEGICLKAGKIRDRVRKEGIDGWEFLDDILEYQGKAPKDEAPADEDDDEGDDLLPGDDFDEVEVESSEKYIRDIVGGRPIFAHPSRKGGFRLRYGRSRCAGLASISINPATMYVLDEFVAIGTQVKVERPGKATSITPCESVEGPIVLLDTGELLRIDTVEEAKRVAGKVERITDIGEMLIPYGEFAENKRQLAPPTYSLEWHRKELERTGKLPANWDDPTVEEAFTIAHSRGVPLHPKFNLFWHDLTREEILHLRDLAVKSGRMDGGSLILPKDNDTKELLIKLGALHREENGSLIVKEGKALVLTLGLESSESEIGPISKVGRSKNPIKLISQLAGITVKAKSPTRIGASMGRPEKAKARKMSPPPHVLFPVSTEGGPQRLVNKAAESTSIKVNAAPRKCLTCGHVTPLIRCPCGSRTEPIPGEEKEVKFNLNEAFSNAKSNLKFGQVKKVKGVKGLTSKGKVPEPLEKGILRARNDVHVFKDGTIRFDMTDLPLTHFRPSEIGITVEKARELGYTHDHMGNELTSPDQLLELMPQDIIPARDAGDHLLRVSHFVDDLLEEFYEMDRFYNAKRMDDLIGELVVGLAPHTSGGILARIIGFSSVRGCYAHPYFHASKRRNCDGDEDCIMLLMDGLLNFSESYLSAGRGGRMDAPLVLSVIINPSEIDKEARNVDTLFEYPLELYRMAERGADFSRLEKKMGLVSSRLGTAEQYEGLGFTHDTPDISNGPKATRYGTIRSMEDKARAQIALAYRIDAVDPNDVANRVVSKHLNPDMIGNLRKFSKQTVRCTRCNRKYRRIPLSGRCECGNRLILTISKGNVVKYLNLAKELAREQRIDPYVESILTDLDRSISRTFIPGDDDEKESEKEEEKGPVGTCLSDFC